MALALSGQMEIRLFFAFLVRVNALNFKVNESKWELSSGFLQHHHQMRSNPADLLTS